MITFWYKNKINIYIYIYIYIYKGYKIKNNIVLLISIKWKQIK